MIEKNKEYIVNIEDMTYEGMGVAKVDNFPLYKGRTTLILG